MQRLSQWHGVVSGCGSCTVADEASVWLRRLSGSVSQLEVDDLQLGVPSVQAVPLPVVAPPDTTGIAALRDASAASPNRITTPALADQSSATRYIYLFPTPRQV